MFKVIYNIFIFVYPKLIAIAAIRNQKAKQWIEGRENVYQLIINKLQNNIDKIIWMHCASLGEFEQGRPVLEELRKVHPDYKILLTFFSPSGYEVRKNYQGADIVCYLPMDSSKNAKQFFDIVNPSLVIFVKYEYWYYYLKEAKQRNINTIIISAIFFPNQIFFKWYGHFYREMLRCFTFIFVQNQASLKLINELNGINNVFLSGDTRFDSVITNIYNRLNINDIYYYSKNNKLIVAGSTWTKDDNLLKDLSKDQKELSFVIAPHDISKARLQECINTYQHAQFYSEWEITPLADTRTIIIDNIGMLSSLYYYAYLCYIGGGWDKEGIHNILEAAVYGKPVIFGPVHHKFIEAEEMIAAGGAFSVDNLSALKLLLHKLENDPVFYAKTSESAQKFVLNRSGATQIIINKIETFRNTPK